MAYRDPRILATARLLENLAELMPKVREHVALELSILDGTRDHTPGSSNPDEHPVRHRPLTGHCTANVPSTTHADELIDCGKKRPCADHDTPVDLTPVERTISQRLRLTAWLDDLDQQCKTIAGIAHGALTAGTTLLGHRSAGSPAQCRDGQIGKDGTIEWGDATCTDGATKSGLCAKHYTAWYRWRKNNDIDTSRMFEPATGYTQERRAHLQPTR